MNNSKIPKQKIFASNSNTLPFKYPKFELNFSLIVHARQPSTGGTRRGSAAAAPEAGGPVVGWWRHRVQFLVYFSRLFFMTPKPYGKFTLEQLKSLAGLLAECPTMCDTLERVIKEATPEKRNEVIQDDFCWYGFYEGTFNEHLASAVLIFGIHDQLKAFAESDDPHRHHWILPNMRALAWNGKGVFRVCLKNSMY